MLERKNIVYLLDLIKYKKMVKEMIISIPPLEEIESGVYEGFCDAYLVKARVRTTIQNHKIVKVELIEHIHENGEAAEKLIDWINEKKSFHVDLVSGASNSCKVMLKAIENSLKKAIES